jgi:hypothetical protein
VRRVESILTKCNKGDVGLCMLRCFEEYHKKGNIQLDDDGVKPEYT